MVEALAEGRGQRAARRAGPSVLRPSESPSAPRHATDPREVAGRGVVAAGRSEVARAGARRRSFAGAARAPGRAPSSVRRVDGRGGGHVVGRANAGPGAARRRQPRVRLTAARRADRGPRHPACRPVRRVGRPAGELVRAALGCRARGRGRPRDRRRAERCSAAVAGPSLTGRAGSDRTPRVRPPRDVVDVRSGPSDPAGRLQFDVADDLADAPQDDDDALPGRRARVDAHPARRALSWGHRIVPRRDAVPAVPRGYRRR